jgi:hypothetical protein
MKKMVWATFWAIFFHKLVWSPWLRSGTLVNELEDWQNPKSEAETKNRRKKLGSSSGLPDCSVHNIPKREKIYQISTT